MARICGFEERVALSDDDVKGLLILRNILSSLPTDFPSLFDGTLFGPVVNGKVDKTRLAIKTINNPAVIFCEKARAGVFDEDGDFPLDEVTYECILDKVEEISDIFENQSCFKIGGKVSRDEDFWAAGTLQRLVNWIDERLQLNAVVSGTNEIVAALRDRAPIKAWSPDVPKCDNIPLSVRIEIALGSDRTGMSEDEWFAHLEEEQAYLAEEEPGYTPPAKEDEQVGSPENTD